MLCGAASNTLSRAALLQELQHWHLEMNGVRALSLRTALCTLWGTRSQEAVACARKTCEQEELQSSFSTGRLHLGFAALFLEELFVSPTTCSARRSCLLGSRYLLPSWAASLFSLLTCRASSCLPPLPPLCLQDDVGP